MRPNRPSACLPVALLAVAALLGAAAAGARPAAAAAAAAGAVRAQAGPAATVAADLGGPAVVAAANRLRALWGVRPLAAARYAAVGSDADWIVQPDADGAAPLELLATWPELLAVLLDPRTTAAATSQRGDGSVALALVTNDAVPLVAPVLPLRLDPGSSIGVAVLLARRPGSVRLLETRGDRELPLPVVLTRAEGAGGAWLARLDAPPGGDDGDTIRLAYGTRYRLVVDGMSWAYTTAPPPAAFLRRSWTYGASMRPADRSEFRRAVASAPAYARTLIAQIDGAVRLERRACDAEDSSCAEYDERGAYSLSIAPADFADTFDDVRFVSLHEIGHLVDFLGLDAAAYADFRALFRTSARWRACFPDDTSDTGCVDFSEILADQFAYWATGLPADPSGGYGDPPLVLPARFEQVLRRHWAFRPPLWRNPAVG